MNEQSQQPILARRSVAVRLSSFPSHLARNCVSRSLGVRAQQFPIAVAPFAQEGSGAQEIDGIIRADLARSGLFRIVDAGSQQIAETANVNLADWKSRGADALVIGSSRRLADGRFDIRFRLLDTVKQTQLDGLAYTVPASDQELTAHRSSIASGSPASAACCTRVAYVVQTGRNSWELHVADADGANSQAALRSLSDHPPAPGRRTAYGLPTSASKPASPWSTCTP
jgi:TolB protein